MDLVDANQTGIEQPPDGEVRSRQTSHAQAWSFVYVFFTNGVPFDSPNRSEPCPPL
jgi:hypothetical protein